MITRAVPRGRVEGDADGTTCGRAVGAQRGERRQVPLGEEGEQSGAEVGRVEGHAVRRLRSGRSGSRWRDLAGSAAYAGGVVFYKLLRAGEGKILRRLSKIADAVESLADESAR